MVSKEKWEYLTKWFTPLVPIGLERQGYVWDDVLDVIKPK
jgi:hypothetical protein